MVKQTRNSKGTSLRYFFLNGEHHRVIRISRSEDLIVAWNYPQGKVATYIWSVAKRSMGKAFTMKSVCKIFSRDKMIIHDYIRDGKIKRPVQTYSLDGRKKPGKFLFSEDDLRDLHSYMLTVHRGRPRKDGMVTNSNLMSRAELEALMKEEKILYTKDKSGEFVPVWKQPDW